MEMKSFLLPFTHFFFLSTFSSPSFFWGGIGVIQAVTKMIQEAMKFADKISESKIKLELIDTLRTVTDGKVKLSRLLFSPPSTPHAWLLNHRVRK